MKTLTVRLPEVLVAEIEAESRDCQITDVVRERLQRAVGPTHRPVLPLAAIPDLIASVDGLPTDLSARKKHYLKAI